MNEIAGDDRDESVLVATFRAIRIILAFAVPSFKHSLGRKAPITRHV